MPRAHSENNVAVGTSEDEDVASESCGNYFLLFLNSVVGRFISSIEVRTIVNALIKG